MNFSSFFHTQIIQESPEEAYDKNNKSLFYYREDARAFIINQNNYVMGQNNSQYHHHLFKYIADEEGYIGYGERTNVPIVGGEISDELLRVANNAFVTHNPRGTSLAQSPKTLLGRIWLEGKVLSFWNSKTDFTPINTETCLRIIQEHTNYSPQSFLFEVEEQHYNYEQFKNLSQTPETHKPEDGWNTKAHVMDPSFKGQFLKDQGMKPKAPMSLVDRMRLNQEGVEILTEAPFSKSKYITKLAEVPMFSIFVHNNVWNDPNNPVSHEDFQNAIPQIEKVFAQAKVYINKMGFKSMHANVVINDIINDIAVTTGTKGVAGYAHKQRKYMQIDTSQLMNFNAFTVDIIVHEWAHLWMFNNS